MTRELMVMISDGSYEYGALLEMRDDGPRAIAMAPPGSPMGVPPPDLARNIQTIDTLLRNGLPWRAVETLAADSPRIGPIVEQISARLNGETA